MTDSESGPYTYPPSNAEERPEERPEYQPGQFLRWQVNYLIDAVTWMVDAQREILRLIGHELGMEKRLMSDVQELQQKIQDSQTNLDAAMQALTDEETSLEGVVGQVQGALGPIIAHYEAAISSLQAQPGRNTVETNAVATATAHLKTLQDALSQALTSPLPAPTPTPPAPAPAPPGPTPTPVTPPNPTPPAPVSSSGGSTPAAPVTSTPAVTLSSSSSGSTTAATQSAVPSPASSPTP